MTKVKRYFDPEDEGTAATPSPAKSRNRKNAQLKSKDMAEIVTFNVKMKKMPWGRNREDQKKKKPAGSRRKAPIAPELLAKHSRGIGVDTSGIKTTIQQKKFERKEKSIKYAQELAAQTEILLMENEGFLEADDGETTTQFTQKQIVNSVDIAAASKHFELNLNDFGPYRAKYTRNGRHLLLGGKMGHVAAFDWVTKRLHCELNVMESIHDISWLHIETMFAVAQKNWVYVYDNQGIELHCIKRLNKVTRMEFLPYHFLLSTASEEGYLSWLDISIGKLVSNYNCRLGKLNILTHNPYNAILCTGHSKGIVAMWSPNSQDPLAKMLCHSAPLTGVHVDPKGVYMATSSANREIKVWDVRKLAGPTQSYRLHSVANDIKLSQKNLLSVAMGNVVEVYKDCCATTAKRPYIKHRFNNTIENINFCPFEDVLGVGTAKGFTSLLVPGAGEANFDAFECNPYQTKTQRREFEVKSLLEKIQPELISLDPGAIAEVDVPTLKDKIEMKKKLLHLKPPKINYEPRNKAKGRGSAAKIIRNKRIVQEIANKEFVKNLKTLQKAEGNKKMNNDKTPESVLDRFLPKKK